MGWVKILVLKGGQAFWSKGGPTLIFHGSKLNWVYIFFFWVMSGGNRAPWAHMWVRPRLRKALQLLWNGKTWQGFYFFYFFKGRYIWVQELWSCSRRLLMKFKIGNGCIQIYNTILHMLHNAIESHHYELLKSQKDYQNYQSNKWHLNFSCTS